MPLDPSWLLGGRGPVLSLRGARPVLGIDSRLLGAGPPVTSWVPLGPAQCSGALAVGADGGGWGGGREGLSLSL